MSRLEDVTIVDEDLPAFADANLPAYRDFENELWLEQQPDEPEIPDEVAAWFARRTPHGHVSRAWVARTTDGLVVGLARLWTSPTDNLHAAEVDLRVRAEWRRRGVGRALLTPLLDAARSDNRSLLLGLTFEQVAAGEEFARAVGATPGLVQRSSDLDLTTLNRDFVADWVEHGERVSDRYELWFVDGQYPPETYADIAQIQNVMNTAPHDDLDIGDDNWTEERVAEGEVRNLESPGERWALFIRERSTAKLVALTRVYFYPTWPGHVDQGDTGVDTAHRNQGLGRWIKAAMIERILRERPDARRIRTSNAFSNDPMLAINDALGFKVTNALTRWQIATDALQAAL